MFSSLPEKPYLYQLTCVLGRSLFLKIEKVTGISKLIQMLFYRGSFIQPHVLLRDYGLKGVECVSLLVNTFQAENKVFTEYVLETCCKQFNLFVLIDKNCIQYGNDVYKVVLCCHLFFIVIYHCNIMLMKSCLYILFVIYI